MQDTHLTGLPTESTDVERNLSQSLSLSCVLTLDLGTVPHLKKECTQLKKKKDIFAHLCPGLNKLVPYIQELTLTENQLCAKVVKRKGSWGSRAFGLMYNGFLWEARRDES